MMNPHRKRLMEISITTPDDDGDELSARLARMGLTVEILHTALRRGEFAAANCTRHHPVTAPSLYRWAEATKEFRDLTAEEGWTTSDVDGIPRTLAPDATFGVVIISGNEHTGNKYNTPSPRHARGSAGVRDVRDNHQLWLFEARSEGEHVAGTPERPLTWYLLHRATDTHIFSELSLPVLATEGGMIEGWRERIILPAIDVNDESVRTDRADGQDDHGDLDVPVVPKRG